MDWFWGFGVLGDLLGELLGYLERSFGLDGYRIFGKMFVRVCW